MLLQEKVSFRYFNIRKRVFNNAPQSHLCSTVQCRVVIDLRFDDLYIHRFGTKYRMIKFACEGGAATGKPVGVCGEAGGDPLMALVLTGLGVSSLSMAATKVNAVRAALHMHDLSTCQQMAAYALDARTAKDARAAVIALADPQLLDLL